MQVVPELFQQVVKVPAVVSWDWHAVRDFVDNVQLLNGDLIDFVEYIDAGDVNSGEENKNHVNNHF